jgi:hypothetical protein
MFMSSIPLKWRAVKPAVCESKLHRKPLAPCEILPAGLPGLLEINGTVYAVDILGYLPAEGEPVVDGFRLTKDDGTAHDVCLVAGRSECTCGDWIWRRASQADPELLDCKHCIACRRHFVAPVDQNPARIVRQLVLADDDEFDNP